MRVSFDEYKLTGQGAPLGRRLRDALEMVVLIFLTLFIVFKPVAFTGAFIAY